MVSTSSSRRRLLTLALTLALMVPLHQPLPVVAAGYEEFTTHMKLSNQAFLNRNADLAEQENNLAEKALPRVEKPDEQPDYDSCMVVILQRRGQICYLREQYDQAEKFCKEAQTMAKYINFGDVPVPAAIDFWLGSIYIKQKRFDEAIAANIAACDALKSASNALQKETATGLSANFEPLWRHYGSGQNLKPLLNAQLGALERVGMGETLQTVVAHIYLGDIASAANDIPLAQSEYKKAYDIAVKGSDETAIAGAVAKTVGGYLRSGQYAEAEKFCKETLEATEKRLGPNDVQCAGVRVFLARIYLDTRRIDEAAVEVKKAKEILGRSPDSLNMASCWMVSMLLHQKQGNMDEATADGEKAVAILAKHPKIMDLGLIAVYDFLAQIYMDQHKYDKAEACLKPALEAYSRENPESAATASTMASIAALYYAQGDYEQAAKYGENSVRIDDKVLGRLNPQTAYDLAKLANIYRDAGKPDEAEMKRLEAFRIFNEAAPNDIRYAGLLMQYADRMDSESNYSEAEKAMLKAHAIVEKFFGADSDQVNEGLLLLSIYNFDAGRNDVAEERNAQALAFDEKHHGAESAEVARDLKFLARIYEKTGDKVKAADVKKRLTQIQSKLPSAPPAAVAENPVISTSADIPKAKQSQAVGNKYALVIGVSNFEDPMLNLRYAAKDARDFARFLETDGHFPKENVKLLVDKNANREAIVNALGKGFLGSRAQPDDLVVVYISSHGGTDLKKTSGLNFFVPYDANATNLLTQGIPMEWFSQILESGVISKRVLMFMDVCHSGAAAESKGLTRERMFDSLKVEPRAGQIIVCSSLANQLSWESKKYENSVFTRCLIDALRSNGNATKLGDAFEQMRTRVESEVLTDRHEEQTPIMKRTWNGDDIMLSAPARQGLR